MGEYLYSILRYQSFNISVVLRIHWIHKHVGCLDPHPQKMRIHGSGSKGQNIIQIRQINTFCAQPPNMNCWKKIIKNFIISEWLSFLTQNTKKEEKIIKFFPLFNKLIYLKEIFITWIRIRFFQCLIQDPDPHQNLIDPKQHWLSVTLYSMQEKLLLSLTGGFYIYITQCHVI